MEDKEFDDIIRDDIEKQIKFQIYKCFKVHGVEGTESKINEIYSTMPELKALWLTEYWKIIRGKNARPKK